MVLNAGFFLEELDIPLSINLGKDKFQHRKGVGLGPGLCVEVSSGGGQAAATVGQAA